MVVGRERDLAIAMNVIQDGGSLDVVGSRGSGRTTFLEAVCLRLQNAGWVIVRLRGVASLRQHPLAAMQLAGVVRANDSRPLTIQSTAEALETLVRDKRAVIVIDDWDDLDEASWGIVEGTRRSLGVPVIISRLQGRHARHTPSGLDASTLEPAFVIDITPLRFDELESAVETVFEAPVEISTMRRIYAKSGGIVGLATSVVAAAIRDGRIRKSDGAWTATRDLWSAGLRGVVEAHIENLDDDALDALEVIALVGDADIDTVRKLVAWPTLELLEQRAMIQVVTSGNRHLVTVVPPLLVEFFRNEPLAARRMRLQALIGERLGMDGERTPVPGVSSGAFAPDKDAALVRLVHERTRTRQVVTRAEWEARPEPHTAYEYVTALMNAGAPDSMITAVLNRPGEPAGDPLGQARLAILRARWTASVGDVDSALRDLDDARAAGDALAGMFAAAAVTIECEHRSVPEDFATRLEVDDLTSEPVRAALWDAQILVLTTLGRFVDASRVFAQYEADERAAVYMPGSTRALNGLALLGVGRLGDALTWSMRGVDESFGLLDVDTARAHGAVGAVCMIMSGDNAAVEDLVATLVAAGPFPRVSAGYHRMLLTMAAVVAIRRGNVALGERYRTELTSLPGENGLLPGQSESWSHAQLLASDGDALNAAAVLWETGERLWARGGRMSGILSMLNACEVAPQEDWLDALRARMTDMDSPLLSAHYSLVVAAAAQDGPALEAAVPGLVATGRMGMALAALRRAAHVYRAAGDDSRARDADARASEYLESLPLRSVDADRFAATTVKLTDREVEIARLVAEGMSNPAIASQLVLSVRTVESHMHRIMRKLDLPNRQSVGDYILSHHGM
ncbi:helix-turn-helix domain-containing protein [Microbacterium sp. Leaf320]|uniref:helix-turn-helix domain-containing protein n=1 Tax=Microbacterium sp. Leaf320 TaxID=1736334 RepID=UPI000AA6A5EA|nr:helix-turn-helix transcriptional regulator [Microbacterium sp. Leaf320]